MGAKCEYRLLWWDFQGSIIPKSSKNQWFHQITPKYYGEVPKLHHHIAGRVQNMLYKKRCVRVVSAKCEYRLLWLDFQGSITHKISKNQCFRQITPKYYGEVPKLHHRIAGRVENILYKKRGVRVVGAKCEYRLLWWDFQGSIVPKTNVFPDSSHVL